MIGSRGSASDNGGLIFIGGHYIALLLPRKIDTYKSEDDEEEDGSS